MLVAHKVCVKQILFYFIFFLQKKKKEYKGFVYKVCILCVQQALL
jgi:hypothetical protein